MGSLPQYPVSGTGNEPVGRPHPEALEPRELEEEWKEVIYGGSGQSQEPGSQCPPEAAEPWGRTCFQISYERVEGHLVAFREILCSWTKGKLKET